MSKETKIKNCYFITKDNEFVGYSYDKELAKAFLETREDSSYKMKKIKVKKLKEDGINLNNFCNEEIVIPVIADIPLTLAEEEVLYLSLDTYLIDIPIFLNRFLRSLNIIKFTDDEKENLSKFCNMLSNRLNEMKDNATDDEFDHIEYTMEIFDTDKMTKWFISNNF